MSSRVHVFVSAALLMCAAVAHAQVTIKDAWVRPTVAQQQATGAFLQITAAHDTRLVAVRSPVAQVAEIHEMAMQGDVMTMRPLAGLDLPAGRPVVLKPGGMHVMLMQLRQPIHHGEQVPLILVFEGRDGRRETVEVKAVARAATGQPAAGGHGAHPH